MGPTGFAVGDDGTFWIGDGVQNWVLRYSPGGELIAAIDLNGIVTGIGDIAVKGEDLAVLDIASVPPAVHVADGETGMMDALPVPIEFGLASGLSGVGYGPSGEILVELEGGARVGVVVDANGESTKSLIYGYPVADGIFAVEEPASTSGARSSAVVRLAETRIQITVDHTLGGIYFLQAREGTLSMLVEEATQDEAGVLRVDQTVRLFARDEKLLGIGRVPLAEYSVYVSNGVAAGPDGRIWGLVTRSDRVDVVEVVMQDEVPRTLPLSPIEVDSAPHITASATACRSRESMGSVFLSYYGNSKHLNDTNINGSCSGRSKPRYLGGPGVYDSVSYDWAGWDLPATFNSQMDQNKQAGDITSSGVATCSRGTDCSGLVSRTWGLSTKHSTTTLVDVSSKISESALLAYDVFNKAGSHVAHHHSRGSGGNGWYISESTTAESFDRVVYRWVPTSWSSGYTPRRYNDVCA